MGTESLSQNKRHTSSTWIRSDDCTLSGFAVPSNNGQIAFFSAADLQGTGQWLFVHFRDTIIPVCISLVA